MSGIDTTVTAFPFDSLSTSTSMSEIVGELTDETRPDHSTCQPGVTLRFWMVHPWSRSPTANSTIVNLLVMLQVSELLFQKEAIAGGFRAGIPLKSNPLVDPAGQKPNTLDPDLVK